MALLSVWVPGLTVARGGRSLRTRNDGLLKNREEPAPAWAPDQETYRISASEVLPRSTLLEVVSSM